MYINFSFATTPHPFPNTTHSRIVVATGEAASTQHMSEYMNLIFRDILNWYLFRFIRKFALRFFPFYKYMP